MAVTADTIITFARGILGDDPHVPKLPVEKYLAAIPRLPVRLVNPRRAILRHRGDVILPFHPLHQFFN